MVKLKLQTTQQINNLPTNDPGNIVYSSDNHNLYINSGGAYHEIVSLDSDNALDIPSLKLNGVAITASAADLNIISGTSTSSKVLVLDNNNDIGGINILETNKINILDTTNATGTTSGGTLTTAGGVAIAKSLYIGGTI